MLGAPAAHAPEGGCEFLATAQAGPSQHPPVQDGAAGIPTTGCLRERRATASAAGFQVTGRVWAGNADVPPATPSPQPFQRLSKVRD